MNPYIYMVETTGSSLTEFPPIFNTFIEMMPENKSTVHAISMLISNRFYKICTMFCIEKGLKQLDFLSKCCW